MNLIELALFVLILVCACTMLGMAVGILLSDPKDLLEDDPEATTFDEELYRLQNMTWREYVLTQEGNGDS